MDKISVLDPNQHVFGPPGSRSGSTNQKYGFGSFYHQAKIVKKNLDSYCFVTSFGLFISEKWFKCLFFIFYNIQTFIHSITFFHRHSLRPLSISSSLVCSVGKHPPVVPSRESNSGLPYSKPTRYHLSHAAPLNVPSKSNKQENLFLKLP